MWVKTKNSLLYSVKSQYTNPQSYIYILNMTLKKYLVIKLNVNIRTT